MFRYSDANGVVVGKTNWNSSLLNIAGISNDRRNVFGMMPHSERAADPDLGNTNGKLIFESLLKGVPA